MAGFTDKFSVRVKKEFAKIKALEGFKAKREYIWEYYKNYFLIIVLAVFVCVSIGRSIISNNYDTALYISMINCSTADIRDDSEVLLTLATDWLGIDGKAVRASVDGYYQIDANTITSDTYSSQMKLMSIVSAKMSDCYFSDEEFLTTLADTDYFYDLEELLPEELFISLGDRILYYNDINGESKAYGVDLSGLPIVDTLVFNIESPIFSVVLNAPHPEACALFLEGLVNFTGLEQ